MDDEGKKLFLEYDELTGKEASHIQILLYKQALKDAGQAPFI